VLGHSFNAALFLLARSLWRLALAWGGRFCVLTLDKRMQKEINP
jgi:hypothetical protein